MAWAAAGSGLELTVFVPERAPRAKLDAIRASGADLRPCPDYDAAERSAKAHAAAGHGLYISPYSHPDIIAGAGTLGLEILAEWPEVDVIVVPIGGGGLISGVAIAARAVSPRTTVHGVEVEASSPFTRGLAAGHIVEIDVGETLADGLSGNLDPDTVTFEIVRRNVSDIALVSEEGLREAIRGMAEREETIVEAAGAAGVAAVLSERLGKPAQRIAVIASGGNIDRTTLDGILGQVT
jgi:threonine dehydratase